MTWMMAGLLVFLGVHSIGLFAEGWRNQQVARFGEWGWKGIYSVASIIGLALAIWGFGQMRLDPTWIWQPPLALQHGVALLMLPAFILLVAAYFPNNHLKARLGHPMLLAVKLWAFSHLLVNGRLGDMVFFGAFLIWAIALFAVLRRRDRQRNVHRPPGRLINSVATVILGIVFWYLFAMHLHVYVAGVPAIRMG